MTTDGQDGTAVDPEVWGVAALDARRAEARRHQAAIAARRNTWISRNRYYYDCIASVLRFIVEPGKRVLNVRCETGHLLDAVAPGDGVGVDLTEDMITEARRSAPNHRYLVCDPEDLDLDETFDYVPLK